MRRGGAFRNRGCNTWRAVVTRRGCDYYLGSYQSREEALAAAEGFRLAFDALVPSASRKKRGPYKLKCTVEERFWAFVDKQSDPDGCWLWTGALNEKGYGKFNDGNRMVRAHLWLNPRPHDGVEADHLCRVRNCVRPSHIELVTHAENLRRIKER